MTQHAADPPAPRRTVGAGSGLTAIAQLAAAVAGGLMSILVARALGPADFGRFSLVQSALLILGLVCTLGIEVGLSYHVGGRRWRPPDALRQSTLAALALGLGGVAIGTGIAAITLGSAFRGLDLSSIVLALAALPFILACTFGSFLAISVTRYGAAALITAGQAVALLVLIAALAPTLGLTGALLGLVLSNVVVAAAALVWGARSYGRPSPGWLAAAGHRLAEAAGFGIRSTAAASLASINQRLDMYLLNAVAAGAVVGHYAVAVSVTSLGLLAPRAFSQVLMPRVAALADPRGKDELRTITLKSIRHGMLIAGATSVVLVIGLAFVPLLYGSDYDDAVGLGLILVPGVAALGVANVLAASVIGRGRPDLALRAALIVTPPSIVAYAIAVPAADAVGAAIASTASYVATAVLMWFAFRTATGERSLASLLPRRDDFVDYRDLIARALAAGRRRLA